MAHAYAIAGDAEPGIRAALAHVERMLCMEAAGNPDVSVLRYQLFSVDEARAFARFAAQAPVAGERKALIIVADRFYHEAQNALLKLFEEPPAGTTLVLVVPAMGDLLPTMRSRVTELPHADTDADEAAAFLALDRDGRATYVAKLLDRAKADKDEEKRRARTDALHLAEGLARAAYRARVAAPDEALDALLVDLDTFVPILHDSSAPLKLIFEHLLLVIPPGVRA